MNRREPRREDSIEARQRGSSGPRRDVRRGYRNHPGYPLAGLTRRSAVPRDMRWYERVPRASERASERVRNALEFKYGPARREKRRRERGRFAAWVSAEIGKYDRSRRRSSTRPPSPSSSLRFFPPLSIRRSTLLARASGSAQDPRAVSYAEINPSLPLKIGHPDDDTLLVCSRVAAEKETL